MKTQTQGGFAPQSGSTLLRLIVGPAKDKLDELAGEALQLMLQASLMHSEAERQEDSAAKSDITVAWILSSGVLHLISDEVKHYDFIEAQRLHSMDALGFTEPSGSMSSGISEAELEKTSQKTLSSAAELIERHAAKLAPKPVTFSFTEGSTDPHAAMDVAARLFESDSPQNMHIVFITDGEATNPPSPPDLGFAADEMVTVRSVDELPELLAQRLKDLVK